MPRSLSLGSRWPDPGCSHAAWQRWLPALRVTVALVKRRVILVLAARGKVSPISPDGDDQRLPCATFDGAGRRPPPCWFSAPSRDGRLLRSSLGAHFAAARLPGGLGRGAAPDHDRPRQRAVADPHRHDLRLGAGPPLPVALCSLRGLFGRHQVTPLSAQDWHPTALLSVSGRRGGGALYTVGPAHPGSEPSGQWTSLRRTRPSCCATVGA